MLQAIRERVLGWLGWIVIGLIIITFAAFGLSSYLRDKSHIYAAKVNGEEIPPRELQMAYQQARNRLEQQMGKAFDPAKVDDVALRKQALDSLIHDSLMSEAARRDGFVIGDQYLGAYIRSIPALQENGEFSSERYDRLVYAQGMTKSSFESDVRQELQMKQWVQAFAGTAFVLPSEIKSAYNLFKQKRSFSYVILPIDPVKAQITVSDEELHQYYDTHAKEFETPERIKLNYVRLSRADLAKGMTVDEAALKSLYEEKKASLVKQEQRRAHHILIQVAPDAKDDAVAKARAKAEDLVKKLRAGASFDELAKANSDDPGSSDKGGDLGFFARGAMVPAFDNAVFGMKPGEISDPVQSQFGFHIIRLDEIQASKEQSLDEARPALEEELKNREAEDVYYDHLDRLTNLSYENSQSLDPAAQNLGLKVEESDWLTAQGGPGIGQYHNLMDAVFSDDVLEGGNNSEPIEVGQDDVIVARVKDREPAQLQPFDEVKARITDQLKADKAKQQIEAKGEALVKSAHDGDSLDKIAETAGAKVEAAKSITRDDRGHPAPIVQRAFRMPRAGTQAAQEQGFEMPNGDYVVLKLDGVEDVNIDSIPKDEKDALESAFQTARQNSDVSMMVDYLRSVAEIQIPEDATQGP